MYIFENCLEGQDYSQVIELVVFEPGEVEKSVEIVITDDREVEKERETIYLYLTGGDDAVLTPFPNTVVAITDDDGELEPHADCIANSFLQSTSCYLSTCACKKTGLIEAKQHTYIDCEKNSSYRNTQYV